MKFATVIFTIIVIECIFFTESWARVQGTPCGLVIWVRGANKVPEANLVRAGVDLPSGGSNGKPFYVCRVQHDASALIGKLTKVKNGNSYCWVTDGTSEYAFDNEDFDALVDWNTGSSDLAWKETVKGGQAGLDAFFAGQTRSGGVVYIGQCAIKTLGETTVIPGAVVGESKAMQVAFNRESPSCTPQKYLACKS